MGSAAKRQFFKQPKTVRFQNINNRNNGELPNCSKCGDTKQTQGFNFPASKFPVQCKIYGPLQVSIITIYNQVQKQLTLCSYLQRTSNILSRNIFLFGIQDQESQKIHKLETFSSFAYASITLYRIIP